MKRSGIIVAAALLLLVALMALKPLLVAVPAVPPSAAPGEFDTARAKARLARVLGPQAPHPVDSDGDDAVRGRLVAELQAMGLTPSISDDMTCNGSAKDRGISCARIRNVLVTIGPAEGRHLLLVSHYDSTPVGPGASDDGIGVASMLEIAELLKGAPLRQPVSFLFDEGEEAGLIGARAFLQRNPLAARVDTLVNLESRGVNGPAIMFETSRPNGRALAYYSQAVERPLANSLTTDFYHLIPNSTDVSVFESEKWTILNFAVIGNETRYHSPGDRLDSLDPQSLHHMGSQALQIARMYGSGQPPAGGAERLYADVLGRFLISFDPSLGVMGLTLFLVIFGVLLFRHRRSGLRALAAVAGALAAAGIAVFLLKFLLGLVRSGEYWRASPHWMALAVDVTALACSAAALAWIGRRSDEDSLRKAYWFLFLLLGFALSFPVRGSAIFFSWPPLLAAAAVTLKRGKMALALAAFALLFITWAPLLDLSETLLDFDTAWVFAPISALILLPALIELKPLLAGLPRHTVGLGLAALVLAAWLPVAVVPAYSPDRKQRLTIEYAWDAAAKKAQWLVYHDRRALPAVLGKFARDVEVPWSTSKRWAAPAEGPAVEPPQVDHISEVRTSQGRVLTLRLLSRGAETVRLRAEPEADLRAVRVNGVTTAFGKGAKDEDYVLRCHGRSCDGLEVKLLVGSPRAVELTVVGMHSGLPAGARPLLDARPPDAQPQYVPDASYGIGRIRL
ncbi:MAG: M28 family peptidase [Alphaproteobacteria bacterium]|nr:MAG: M28 family peptidase [Alphaproteobacteria bacterium]